MWAFSYSPSPSRGEGWGEGESNWDTAGVRHLAALFLIGAGIVSLLFSLARTYYMVWKLKKGRETKGDRRS
jgi:hypothetical protein